MATGEWITSEPETFSVPGHGADTHWVPAPHYPTSADLAAFRHRISGSVVIAARPIPGAVIVKPSGGAWPHEREHGIGFTYSRACPDKGHTGCHDQWCDQCQCGIDEMARAGANRLRREAWERSGFGNDPVTLAIETFAPTKPLSTEVSAPFRPESESELRFAYGDR